MSKISKAIILALAIGAWGCDEGRIYKHDVVDTREGRTVKVTADVSGVGSWEGGYQLVVAGYDDSDYAEITKEITGPVTVVSGIPDNVRTIEVCVVNRLRKRIVTFDAYDIAGLEASDTIRWDVGATGGTMFDAVQRRVFNTTCANCHGGSNHTAAGLYLTEGRSYEAIIGRPSSVVEGETVVIPGDASKSLMYKILTTDLSSTWAYDHSVEVVDQSVLDMIGTWIDNGAQR